MIIQQEPDYARFLREIRAGIGDLELLHTPLFALAEGLAVTRPRQPIMALVERQESVCVGAALLPPSGAVELARARRDNAAGWAERLGTAPFRAMSLSGSEEIIEAVALYLDGSWVRRPVQLVMACQTVPSSAASAGRLRRAQLSDTSTVGSWLSSFLAETGQQPVGNLGTAAASLIERNLLRVWEVGGVPVSMAAIVSRTAHTARVSLVYTAATQRRNGYAAACVSAISHELRTAEGRTCCLHVVADRHDLVRLYLRTGYAAVGRRLDLVRAG